MQNKKKKEEVEEVKEMDKAANRTEIDKLHEEITNLKKNLEEKEKEIKEYKEKTLRTMAELNNFKQKLEQESREFMKYAEAELIKELFTVLDHFDAALKNSDENTTVKSMRDGMELVYKELMKVFSKQGLKVQETVGVRFDPSKHEAVLQLETNEHEEGIIVEELRKGYEFKDKVIRPAMVKVAKYKLAELPVIEDEIE